MKPAAIVYTSNTGHTARYAQLLGRETGLPVYPLAEAKALPQGTPIIYLGWLMASQVKGCKQAARRFPLLAVCGVGLGKSGSQLEQVRQASALTAEIPLFTLQGGLDKEKLRGANKAIIGVLTRALDSTKNRTPEQEEMLQLIRQGGRFRRPGKSGRRAGLVPGAVTPGILKGSDTIWNFWKRCSSGTASAPMTPGPWRKRPDGRWSRPSTPATGSAHCTSSWSATSPGPSAA